MRTRDSVHGETWKHGGPPCTPANWRECPRPRLNHFVGVTCGFSTGPVFGEVEILTPSMEDLHVSMLDGGAR